ncbi:MAG: hypothetical protein EA397_18785 [Deltaproteobacteria bacterium]|nr:MAG: hypothetical protein EA397_18785 [Deltaproteobacteria bacterium]
MILLLSSLAALAAPVQLDFGGEGSPVLPGFAKVTPWSSEDGRAGWVGDPPRAREGTWPDALLADHVTGGTLHLDVPEGDYTLAVLFSEELGRSPKPAWKSGVRIEGLGERLVDGYTIETFFGSRFFARNPRPDFRAEPTVWDRQIGPATPWRVEAVRAQEGGLQLTAFGAPMAALVLTPADRATTEVELFLIDDARKRWYLDHHPEQRPDKPMAGEGLAGLELLPWSGLPSEPRPAKVEAALSPGESHSWLFAVHGSDEPAQVELHGLEGLHPELHEVDWLDVQDKRLLAPRPHVVRPLDGELKASQGLVPLLALSVRVPAEARPGSVRGQVRIRRGEDVLVLPVSLRVRALQLEAPRAPLGVWVDLRSHQASLYGPDSDEAKASWDRDVALLRRYEFTSINLRGLYFPGPWPRPGALPPPERLRWAAQAWKRAGGEELMWVDPMFLLQPALREDHYLPVLDPPAREAVMEMMRSAAEVGAGIYLFDEFGAQKGLELSERYRRMFELADTLRDEGEPPLGVAEPVPAFWDLLADHADQVYLHYPLDPVHVDFFAGRRAEPRSYGWHYARETSGRLSWLQGVRMVSFWHMGDFEADPYADVRPRVHFHLAMPTPDGHAMYPTRRLQMAHRGLQDQRVLLTLSALLHEVRAARGRRITALRERGCALLQVAGRGLVGRDPRSDALEGLSQERSLDRMIHEVGEVAEALARSSRRQRLLRRGRVDTLSEAPAWPDQACGPRPDQDDAWRYGPGSAPRGQDPSDHGGGFAR